MTEKPQTVVLLHGLARSSRSMQRLQRRVEAAGYRTWTTSYPSRQMPLEQLARLVTERLQRDLGHAPLFAVTHSLGGILVRWMGSSPWRGLVMIAPPNRGSCVAARLSRSKLFRWTHGPAGLELASDAGWPPPPCPFAVIAGTQSLALGNPTSWVTRASGIFGVEPSDGTVTVKETMLDGMADFATVDACHTWIADHPAVGELVVRFLAHGDFGSRDEPRW